MASSSLFIQTQVSMAPKSFCVSQKLTLNERVFGSSAKLKRLAKTRVCRIFYEEADKEWPKQQTFWKSNADNKCFGTIVLYTHQPFSISHLVFKHLEHASTHYYIGSFFGLIRKNSVTVTS